MSKSKYSSIIKVPNVIEAIEHLANNDASIRSHMLLKLIINGEQQDLDKHLLRYQYGITERMANHCYSLHEQWVELLR